MGGFPGGDAFDASTVFGQDCDILIPAALGGVITKANAGDVKAKLIVEGANAPTTTGADHILRDKGVTVIPDILANAGGVTVSYFEWVQNLQQFFWEESEVFEKEEKIMVRAFNDVHATVVKHGCTYRTGAFVLALDRVYKANVMRGW